MTENGARRGRPGYDQQGILEVAVAAFNEYGYDATSMGVLADRLGLSKSAIYHHFASKDARSTRPSGRSRASSTSPARPRAARPTGSTTCCAAPCTSSSTSCRT